MSVINVHFLERLFDAWVVRNVSSRIQDLITRNLQAKTIYSDELAEHLVNSRIKIAAKPDGTTGF